LNIAACHLPKLEVSCDIGRDEDVGQLSTGHKELRYEIDIPVVDASILLPWLFVLVVLSVLLEELADIRKSLQGIEIRLTVSMLTEAASLLLVSLYAWPLRG
jgi:hypothetical protein